MSSGRNRRCRLPGRRNRHSRGRRCRRGTNGRTRGCRQRGRSPWPGSARRRHRRCTGRSDRGWRSRRSHRSRRNRGRRLRRFRQSRRERLARARENLSGFGRRRNRARGNHRSPAARNVRNARLAGRQRRTNRKCGPHRRGWRLRCLRRFFRCLRHGSGLRLCRGADRLRRRRRHRCLGRAYGFLGGGGFALLARRLGWFCKGASRHAAADLQGDIVVERTGMRLLFGDAQLRQHVQDDARLDFEFPRQLVNANFTHT